MIKIFYKILIFVLIFFLLFVGYFAYFGFTTSKFNTIIKNQIKKQNNELDIDLKKVKLHLNLKNFSIRIKTSNTQILISNSDNIDLKEISSSIAISSYFKNKFALKNLLIKTKENNISSYINLYRLSNNNLRYVLLNQLVKSGTAKINVDLNFDDFGKVKKNYNLKGKIINAELQIPDKDNIKDLNFDFTIKENDYKLDKILFKYEKINFNSEFLNIKKENNKFSVKGNLNNKKNKIDSDLISILFKNNLDILDFSDSKFDSSSKFSFYLTKNFKVKDLFIDSNLNLNELILNYESDKIRNYISAYKNEIKIKENKLKVKYEKNKVILNGSSEFYIQENKKNIIDFNFKKINDLTSFEALINLSNIDFKVNEISYQKKANSNVGLEIKGSTKKNKIFLKKINYI